MRSCADCRAYQHHESGPDAGTVERMPAPDDAGGTRFIPLPRAPNCSPPCDECPKIDPDEPRKHWSQAAEFGPWFWAAYEWFEEGRACGDLAGADPLMRAVAAAFDRHARHLDAREAAAPVVHALATLFGQQ